MSITSQTNVDTTLYDKTLLTAFTACWHVYYELLLKYSNTVFTKSSDSSKW